MQGDGRHVKDPGRQPGNPVKPFFRRSIEQFQSPQGLESLGLIARVIERRALVYLLIPRIADENDFATSITILSLSELP